MINKNNEAFTAFALRDSHRYLSSPLYTLCGTQTMYPPSASFATTSLGERAALEQGLRSIARLHPSALDLYEGGIAMLWQNDPHAGGAFTFCHAHEEAQFAEPARTAEGRIFFAGEHTAIFRRWIQGALESGLRVANEVHTRTAHQSLHRGAGQRITQSCVAA